jgi:Ubiquitin-conjugating enzyme
MSPSLNIDYEDWLKTARGRSISVDTFERPQPESSSSSSSSSRYKVSVWSFTVPGVDSYWHGQKYDIEVHFHRQYPIRAPIAYLPQVSFPSFGRKPLTVLPMLYPLSDSSVSRIYNCLLQTINNMSAIPLSCVDSDGRLIVDLFSDSKVGHVLDDIRYRGRCAPHATIFRRAMS